VRKIKRMRKDPECSIDRWKYEKQCEEGPIKYGGKVNGFETLTTL